MGNVCNSLLIGNRIEDHVFCNAMIFCESGQKNTRSLCCWILLSRASDAEHGMVVVMLRTQIRMKMSTPPPPTLPLHQSAHLEIFSLLAAPWFKLWGNMEWAGTSLSSLQGTVCQPALGYSSPQVQVYPQLLQQTVSWSCQGMAFCPLGPEVLASLRTTPVPAPNSLSSLLRPSSSLGAPVGGEDH